MSTTEALRIGFVGLGDMGKGMAANLVRNGFDVAVRDLRPEAVDELVALGADAAASNADVSRDRDVVVVVVVNDQQVRDVCVGTPETPGVIAGLTPGAVVVVASTVSLAAHRAVSEHAATHGVQYVDAAMTGGSVGARDGTLTFFVGGPVAATDRITPVLEAMGNHVFRCGELGAGAAVKIVNNLLSISHILAAREAIRLAAAAGVSESDLLSMINTGDLGSSWATRSWERLRWQERNHTAGPAGMVAMTGKDLRLARDLAADLGVDAPLVQALVDDVLPGLGDEGLTS